MSITVTPDPDPVVGPPKVDGQVAVPVGAVMSSLEVFRTDPNGRQLVRTQPAAGFDLGSFEDFDCPYGVDVFYDWNAVYTDPASYVTVFNETWSSMAAWTPTSGSWNVSSGRARSSSTIFAKTARAVSPDRYRVTIAAVTAALPDYGYVVMSVGAASQLGFGSTYGSQVQIIVNSATSIGVVVTQSGVQVYSGYVAIDPTHPIIVDFFADSILVSGTGGLVSIPASFAFDTVSVATSQAVANTITFDDIKVQSYPAPSTIAEVSDTIVLDPLDDWIIQPAIVAKSVRVANTPAGRKLTGVKSMDDVENASNETLHDIMGSTLAVSTSTGDRAGDVTSMEIWVPDAAAEEALMLPLRDGIPLLFQFNPLRTTHRIASGFYSVGKVRRSRQDPDLYRGVQSRLFDLPLTKAQSPVVQVSAPAFSLADLDLAMVSLADTQASYATLEDLRVDHRV